jgi:uncharacterized membrane protein YgcG
VAAEGSAVVEAEASGAEGRAVAGDLRPLSARQERRVARAVDEAEERTGLQLCVYLGPAGEDARAHAEQLFEAAGLHTRPAVLVLVAPDVRRVEIVTGAEVRDRVTDAGAQRAVDAMTARFAERDLAGGLVAGLEVLAEEAGPGTPPEGVEELPDLLG